MLNERHHKSILIVEDDRAIRDELVDLLRGRGYKIAVASNGAHALAWLEKGLEPTVILLDLMMPVMNGWEFRAKQLEDPRYASIPVVLLTGAWGGDDAVAALHAAGCMSKPFAVGPLLEILDRANADASRGQALKGPA